MMFSRTELAPHADNSDNLRQSRLFLRTGMIMGSLIIFGLAFWILETGPQLAGWKNEWTRELRFTLGGLCLTSLLTIVPVSNFMTNKIKTPRKFYGWSLVLFAWSMILTLGYGLIRIIIAYSFKQPLEEDFVSWGSFAGAYFAILVFVIIPVAVSGVLCRRLIRMAVNFFATRTK